MSPLGFDSIAGVVDQYFKIYKLNLKELIPDENKVREIEDYVIVKVESGKSAYEGFADLLKIHSDKKLIKEVMKKLKKMQD